MINEGASSSKISLNDICYEQIKDNFYYGKFGDFTLVVVNFFNSSFYKNIMCFSKIMFAFYSSIPFFVKRVMVCVKGVGEGERRVRILEFRT
jgi:hypothetical protein